MSAKSVLCQFALIFSLLFCVQVCHAEENSELLQGYAWENYADLFVIGDINLDTVTIDVSNQPTDIVDGGLLADKGVTVRTTVLLDISASMPKSMRNNVIDFISDYVEKLNTNEQLKLVVFGEEITVLQDFTSDRYDLSKAISKIKFEGQKSMIYDAVYNTIPAIGENEGEPCYYRTVVITDGVDEADSGITKEELYLKLQESYYPVEVVEVSGSDDGNSAIEKNLSALARISGGHSVMLNPNNDSASVVFDVSNIKWIRIKLPDVILDGSMRQFNIKDAASELQFDFKVPVFVSNNISDQAEGNTEIQEIENTDGITDKEQDKPSDEEQNENMVDEPIENPGDETDVITSEDDSKSPIWRYVIIALIAVAVICLVVLVVVYVSKKKRSNPITIPDDPADQENGTIILNSGTSMRLRKMDDPDKVWNLVLNQVVHIGRRENCQVFLDDPSVSRSQCIIYSDHEGMPVIENQSKSNVTQVNNMKISAPQVLSGGDQIKCGRIVLMVDSVVSESDSSDKGFSRLTTYLNV